MLELYIKVGHFHSSTATLLVFKLCKNSPDKVRKSLKSLFFILQQICVQANVINKYQMQVQVNAIEKYQMQVKEAQQTSKQTK